MDPFPVVTPLLSMQELRENNIGLENVRICYSPFSRTTHTAKVVASVLDIPLEPPQCKVSTVSTAGRNLIHVAFAPDIMRGNIVAEIHEIEVCFT